MDSLAQLALMAKAKLVFEQEGTFLSFPATTPLSYHPEDLKFDQKSSSSEMAVFSDFSRITNSLSKGVIFEPTFDSFLWDIYLDVLQNAQVSEGTLTAQQQQDLDSAAAFLHSQGPQGILTDSAELIAYRQYQQSYMLAMQNYKAKQMTASASNDPKVQEQWQDTDEPIARAQVQFAETEWETTGFKVQIEHAEQVVNTLTALSPQLKWQNWIEQCNPDIDFLTDPSNQIFGPTTYSPSNIIDQTNWPSFTISSQEIPKLLGQAPKELTELFGNISGNSSLDSLSFEFCNVTLNRSWFRPEVLDAKFWRFADPSIHLSDGKVPPNGLWPAYITGLVLARNITEIIHKPTGIIDSSPIKSFPPVLHGSILVPPPDVKTLPVAKKTQPILRPVLSPLVIPNPLLGRQVPQAISSPAQTPPSAVTQPSPTTNEISILAFICKSLPQCPNPDPDLNWQQFATPVSSTPTSTPVSSTPTSTPVSSTPTSTPVSSTPTPTPPDSSWDKLVDALKVANITIDHPEWLQYTDYLPFAKGCLLLLGNRRLKIKIDLESIHYNYVEERQVQVDRNSPNGNLDTKNLEESLIEAYNNRTSTSVESFNDIAEPI